MMRRENRKITFNNLSSSDILKKDTMLHIVLHAFSHASETRFLNKEGKK